jgi:hypothetical protein
MVNIIQLGPRLKSMSNYFGQENQSVQKYDNMDAHAPIIFSGKVFVLLLLVVAFTASSIVFIVGEKTVLEELQISAVVILIILFAVLTLGLFRGIELRPDVEPPDKVKGFNDLGDLADVAMIIGLDDIDFGDDLVGCLLGVVLWALVTVFAVIILVFAVNIVIFLMAVLFWIFYNSFRAVYANSNRCQGDIWESTKVGLGYTFLYTGWLLIVVYLVKLTVSQ